MKIMCVIGTRPNIVKMASLYNEMKSRNDINPIIVHTGQHYDKNMSGNFFHDLDIPEPDYNLEVASGTHTYQIGQILLKFAPVIDEISPDLVIVVGDVNSTLAASLVTAKCNIPLAHVEAGLRSGDRSMPEELNRIVVDQLADLLFVTEQSGVENLRKEGIPDGKIHFVGNVMIDTLKTHLKKAEESSVLRQYGLSKKHYALMTLHRPSNVDNPKTLKEIFEALNEISSREPILFPVHPRTKHQMNKMEIKVSKIKIIAPLNYYDFLCAMNNAHVVITDSGGIQEETTILGVPCLTIRNNTERPVTLKCGTNILTGIHKENILRNYYNLPKCNKVTPPLWDGNAAKRIVDIILNSNQCCQKKTVKVVQHSC